MMEKMDRMESLRDAYGKELASLGEQYFTMAHLNSLEYLKLNKDFREGKYEIMKGNNMDEVVNALEYAKKPMEEGNIWESLMAASKYHLGIVIYNSTMHNSVMPY